MFDFTQVFSDYLQLQSFVMDNNHGIGDKSIQDIFLSCCYYKFWIKKHTYDEQKSKPNLYTEQVHKSRTYVSNCQMGSVHSKRRKSKNCGSGLAFCDDLGGSKFEDPGHSTKICGFANNQPHDVHGCPSFCLVPFPFLEFYCGGLSGAAAPVSTGFYFFS